MWKNEKGFQAANTLYCHHQFIFVCGTERLPLSGGKYIFPVLLALCVLANKTADSTKKVMRMHY